MTTTGTCWYRDGIGQIDLHFQGVPTVIAAYLIDTSDGLALVETGPASTLAALLDGIRLLGRDPEDLRHILVTHIHLDHAGAAGVLLQRFPSARLYVHELGAPHLADPSRLLHSAQRIYGDLMGPLWGVILPVDAGRMTVVTDGDVVEVGDRRFDVRYTPGHASHHVVYIERASGVVFSGDVAGVRIPPARTVWPPTPPPDLNAELWHASIAALRSAAPRALLIGHFGVVEGDRVPAHLDELDRRLDDWIEFVAARVAAGAARDDIVRDLTARSKAELAADSGDDALDVAYAQATPYAMSVDGIMRYLRKRTEGAI